MAQVTAQVKTPANFRWNFAVNVWDIMFITMGLRLISRETVMPVLVASLTDSKIAVGLVPAIFALGFYLPQLFSANFSERLRYKKPFVMLISSFGERLPYLLIGLAVWQYAVSNPLFTLFCFYILLATATGSAGFATPAWYDMIAKVIPVNRRGLWSGLSHSLGALMGLVGAYFVGQVLENYEYPNNFSLLFALAFVATALSWVGLALNREPPSVIVKAKIRTSDYFRQLPTILRRDANYVRFILSRSIVQLGTMAIGFFAIYGIDNFAIDGIGIGRLTAVLVSGEAIMNLLWGVVGDRFGHKAVLAAAAIGLTLATVAAALATSIVWLYVTFFLVGAYLAADAVSGLNIILEFCAPEDRPTYIGLTNTLLAPVFALAPIIGGWIVSVAGYQPMFLVALVATTVGGLLLTLWIREPRNHIVQKRAG